MIESLTADEVPDDDETPDLDLVTEDTENAEGTEKVSARKQLHLYNRRNILRMILDEAHFAKNPASKHLHLYNRRNILRMILDEGHFAKNPKVQNSEVIRQIKAKHIWFVTATPMMNKVSDLSGYLFRFFKREWEWKLGKGLYGKYLQLYAGDPTKFPAYDGTFQSILPDSKDADHHLQETDFYLSHVNPRTFRLINSDSGSLGLSGEGCTSCATKDS